MSEEGERGDENAGAAKIEEDDLREGAVEGEDSEDCGGRAMEGKEQKEENVGEDVMEDGEEEEDGEVGKEDDGEEVGEEEDGEVGKEEEDGEVGKEDDGEEEDAWDGENEEDDGSVSFLDWCNARPSPPAHRESRELSTQVRDAEGDGDLQKGDVVEVHEDGYERVSFLDWLRVRRSPPPPVSEKLSDGSENVTFLEFCSSRFPSFPRGRGEISIPVRDAEEDGTVEKDGGSAGHEDDGKFETEEGLNQKDDAAAASGASDEEEEEEEMLEEGQDENEKLETEEDDSEQNNVVEENGADEDQEVNGKFETEVGRCDQDNAEKKTRAVDTGAREDRSLDTNEVQEEDAENGREEDGGFGAEEDGEPIFGEDEFLGDLDGEDEFLQLASDYEYEEEELEDVDQEDKEGEYLENNWNGSVHGEDDEDEGEGEGEVNAFLPALVDLDRKGDIVSGGKLGVGAQATPDEDYIAPEIIELGERLLRSDESEGDDEEPPICRRTRARVSLTDKSLDDLEKFLQGSDDEDDFQTVEDREVYEKFLRAVLEKDDEGGEKAEQSGRKDDEEEEEEEEEDVDFEIEIEAALESDDASESARRTKRKRPDTREKRRQKAQLQSRGTLRQLLPHMGNFANDVSKRNMMTESLNLTWPTNQNRRPLGGEFTARQIGQLYSMMHEHVQLLVQVHSLCVWDPSREREAKETERMLRELAQEREKVLSWKKTAFPDCCFRPPNTGPSAVDGVKAPSLLQCLGLSRPCPPQTLMSYGQSAAVPANATVMSTFGQPPVLPPQAYPLSERYFPSDQTLEAFFAEQASFPPLHNVTRAELYPAPSTSMSHSWQEIAHPTWTDGGQICDKTMSMSPPNERVTRSEWEPIVSGTVHSILDVAPLAVIPDFFIDMARAMQECKQRHVEGGAGRFEREPLFALTVSDEHNQGIGRMLGDVELMAVPPPQIKKTMAAVMVESSKRESISPVPTGVAAAVRRFQPYFNEAFFPHKAQPHSITSRVLFTDAEDELLAMGMMELNHDWKLIQQRYLPCKTEHQVKIRAKNRMSTKANANSIKAVHTFKTSPLTDIEKKAIQEGLGYYKYNWDKIWLNCVPHRDPTTLQRQYRTAIGTQKSYKTNDKTKERRRVYEATRRQKKKESSAVTEDGSPSAVAIGVEGSSDTVTDNKDLNAPDGAHIREDCIEDPSLGPETIVPVIVHVPTPTTRLEGKQKKPLAKKRKPKTQLDPQLSCSRPWLDSQTAKTIVNSRKQTVKLAPGLPCVKLPSHVQVVSQSRMRTQQPPALPHMAISAFSPITQLVEKAAFHFPHFQKPFLDPAAAATTLRQRQPLPRRAPQARTAAAARDGTYTGRERQFCAPQAPIQASLYPTLGHPLLVDPPAKLWFASEATSGGTYPGGDSLLVGLHSPIPASPSTTVLARPPKVGVKMKLKSKAASEVMMPRSPLPVNLSIQDGKSNSKTRKPGKRNKELVCENGRGAGNKVQRTSPSVLKGSRQVRAPLKGGVRSDPSSSTSRSRNKNTGKKNNRRGGQQLDTIEGEGPEPLAEQDIVMEKEELSDSEDEADAGVEFEQEEMGDD